MSSGDETTYEEWLLKRRYRIIQSGGAARRGQQQTIATGLTWEEADTKRNQLQAEYDKAHPKETSWGKDLFLVEMETPQWNPPEHREERTIKK